MGEWRFDGSAGRPSIGAVAFFVASLAFACAGAVLLALAPIA